MCTQCEMECGSLRERINILQARGRCVCSPSSIRTWTGARCRAERGREREIIPPPPSPQQRVVTPLLGRDESRGCQQLRSVRPYRRYLGPTSFSPFLRAGAFFCQEARPFVSCCRGRRYLFLKKFHRKNTVRQKCD